MTPSIIAAPKRIQKPMYAAAAAGAAAGASTSATKVAPHLAQKRASGGLSCPQTLHSTDKLHLGHFPY